MAEPPPQYEPDPVLIDHYSRITDAYIQKPVTPGSSLAALHLPTDRCLRNLVDITDPMLQCSLITGDRIYPPHSDPSTDAGYSLHLGFNRLLYAPCVRLECRMVKVPQVLVLEFHFNLCDSKQLSDFIFQNEGPWSTAWVAFESSGASCQGFNNVAKVIDQLEPQEREIYAILWSLVDSPDVPSLIFDLKAAHLDEATKVVLQKLFDRLPSGTGPLLPSIGKPEYSNFPEQELAVMQPHFLMGKTPPNPMMPLKSSQTFSSVEEICAEHMFAVTMQDWEQKTMLHRFAAAKHKVTVYLVDEFAVAAMKFGEIQRPGRGKKTGHFRLPEEIEVFMNFTAPGLPDIEFKGCHETQPLGLPKHDAFFILSEPDNVVKLFEGKAADSGDTDCWYADVTEVRPHENSFLLNSQRKSLLELRNGMHERWEPILLNQLHDEIEDVDVLNGLDVAASEMEHALKWLKEMFPWNTEQMEVIDALRCAKGRLVLCSGIAGTGKTTLQVALALFFVKIGGKALCTTTANENADHLARALKHFGNMIHKMGIRIYRVFCSSRNVPLADMSQNKLEAVSRVILEATHRP